MNNLIIIGGAIALFYFFNKGATLANLVFTENGASFDLSNPLRPVINLAVGIQNPTSGSLTLMSLAGQFLINGRVGGNVSWFQGPVAVLPNGQTQIILQVTVNDLAMIPIVIDFVNAGTGSLNITVQANANVNNVSAPLNLSFDAVL